MALCVIWTRPAAAELEAIAEYITQDSPSYAATFVQHVFAATRMLARYPEAGRVVPEYGDERVRQWIVHTYRLIYTRRDERLIVLGLIHGARRLPGDLLSRGS